MPVDTADHIPHSDARRIEATILKAVEMTLAEMGFAALKDGEK